MRINTQTQLNKASKLDGTHPLGRGLYLAVRGGSTRWVFRYSQDGKTRQVPIGGYPEMSMKDARTASDTKRLQFKQGGDPKQPLPADVTINTFRQDALAFYDHKQATWKSLAAKRDWLRAMENHVFPAIGTIATPDLTIAQITEVIAPLWATMTKADVLLGRITQIIDHAISNDDDNRFTKGNPAKSVKGRLRQGVQPVERAHGAVPWEFIPALYTRLATIQTPASQALRFLLLCCTPRADEVHGASWDEIKGVFGDEFHVPQARLKRKLKDPRPPGRIIPLCAAALQLLREIRPATTEPGQFVFRTKRAGKQTSGGFVAFAGSIHRDAMTKLLQEVLVEIMPASFERHTVVVGQGKHQHEITRVIDPLTGTAMDCHGLRASFSTWVAANRQTVYDMDAREIALDHMLGVAVTRAYDRADLLSQRRELAERWSGFVTGRQALAQAA